jgi:hypothetical protein
MKPASKSRPGGREPREGATDVDTKNKKTPATDIQPEDTGTPDSGHVGRGAAADGTMKQTSKTGNERGSQR